MNEQQLVADFKVKLQSDGEPQTPGDPGRSLFREVQLLKQQIAQLCQAVRGLVQLQNEANQKLDGALKRSWAEHREVNNNG